MQEGIHREMLIRFASQVHAMFKEDFCTSIMGSVHGFNSVWLF